MKSRKRGILFTICSFAMQAAILFASVAVPLTVTVFTVPVYAVQEDAQSTADEIVDQITDENNDPITSVRSCQQSTVC